MTDTSDTRQAAIEWITLALAEELPPEHTAQLADRAENLAAIAEHNGIPIEALLQWIHIRTPGKEWSSAEWRRWCEKYIQTRRALLELGDDWHTLCPRCSAHLAHRLHDHWICPDCGDVA